MKKISYASVIAVVIYALSSCKGTAPNACYNITTPSDSIRVGHTVSLDASCSTDVSQYYWEFGNGKTSIYGPQASVVYDSAGSYSVALVVSGNGKTAAATKSIVVLP